MIREDEDGDSVFIYSADLPLMCRLLVNRRRSRDDAPQHVRRCNLCHLANMHGLDETTLMHHHSSLHKRGWMPFVYNLLLDSTSLKNALDELASDFRLMVDDFKCGAILAGRSPVRIGVITNGVHWVFVQCCEQIVRGERTIVTAPSRVFEFDTVVPMGDNSWSSVNDKPMGATPLFLNTLVAAMRFNIAQETANVFVDEPGMCFPFESDLVGDLVGVRVRVVDVVAKSVRSIVVRAQLCSAGVAPNNEMPTAEAEAAAVSVGRRVIIKCFLMPEDAAERSMHFELEKLAIPHLMTRVTDCALSDIESVLVTEDEGGVALMHFCLRRPNVRARVKMLLDTQIAVALNAMHQAQLAVIDLHPGNVFVVPSNEPNEHGIAALKLVDLESVLPFNASEKQKNSTHVRHVQGQMDLGARERIDASIDQERFAVMHRWVDQKGEVPFSECFVQDWQSKWPKMESNEKK